MKRIIIRHGHTGVDRDARDSFGAEGPPISKQGVADAERAGREIEKLGINLAAEPVAISTYLRTKQTAEAAGFKKLRADPSLNEIFTGIPNDQLKDMVAKRQVPEIVLQKAQAILDNPPPEKVWVTHGLVIIGLRELLGMQADPFDLPQGQFIELEV